jgi:death-on-curing protein
MIRYLVLSQILLLYRRVIEQSGGTFGIRDRAALESALAQPQMTFGKDELYPTIAEKAAALGYSLIKNHPFVDGNKRVGHAAMEVFLMLNGYEIKADVDDQERIIVQLAAGEIDRAGFQDWLKSHLAPLRN